jgi:hypothetical protein
MTRHLAPRSPAVSPLNQDDTGPRWTKPKMAQFLRELACCHSVCAAAAAVGMSRQSAYRLRNRLKGEPFDIAWEAAFQHGYDALHQAALERALNGVEEAVWFKGEQVGTRRRNDERLTCFLLSARNHQGAQQLGRYRAAADFWSENWDRLLDQVEHGAAHWRPLVAPDLAEEDRANALTSRDMEATRRSSDYTAPDPLPKGRGLR